MSEFVDDSSDVAESENIAQTEDAPPQPKDDHSSTSVGTGVAPIYCAICGAPPEYCEYGATYDRCLPWILEHCPEVLSPDALAVATGKMSLEDNEEDVCD